MPSNFRGLPRRIVRALRRGLLGGSNQVGLAVSAAVLLGTALIVVQLLILGWWLGAAGTLLLGGAGLVLGVKTTKTALRLARVDRQLRDGIKTTGHAAAAPPQDGQRIDAHSAASRLQAIGRVELDVVNPSAKGRQAAAVDSDPLRPFRLYAATRGTVAAPGGAAPENGSGRRIAAIATPRLAARLNGDFSVSALRPGLSLAELEASQPTAVVVEEDALRAGAWYSALQAGGTGLLREIFEVARESRERGIGFYVVASDTLELSSTTLRGVATHVVQPDAPPAAVPGTDGAAAPSLPLLEALESHAASQAVQRSEGVSR
ncbi:hypothetical protein ACQ7DA_07825 [Zafaria sp. J156]|uniref:hypothetical protein n=1 Tax=Zafaria sp. J156 TaxID=3116490 RepID=UPI002E788E2B|nr:hypothetical protein [Zafaria sp. J156]MEE1620720.1 hypothetical protein [Zafaria sp. J156]